MGVETIKIDLSWVSEKANDMLIWFKILINPGYWLMNSPYSSKWDKVLNDLMGRYDFESDDDMGLVAKLGGVEIWIGNHPYASFRTWCGYYDDVRPSKLTIYKAKQKLKRDLNKPKPTEVNGFMGNPFSEIPLGHMMMSGSSLTHISNNVDDYVEITSPMLLDFRMMGNIKPEVGDLKNGIPNNWEDEV
jgi:hypothetical protein